MTTGFLTEERQATAQAPAEADAGFERDVLAGLAASRRSIPPKYFYDAAGSALFDRICELPEYYPTRTELAMLDEFGEDIAHHLGERPELIEYGAGSLTKVRLLLKAFDEVDAPRRFVPIDISGEHLEAASQRLRAEFPRLEVLPVVGDYTGDLQLPQVHAQSHCRVGFFPGSTLGNFEPSEALAFLRNARRQLQGGGLLIGVDLVKAPARLHAAYNDAQQVTAEFNLNLLKRINRELDGDFDLEGFQHHAFYEPLKRRIEMHLISRRRQTVTVKGRRHVFEEGDTLHTESSHKFTVTGFHALARQAGFEPERTWTDPERLFSLHWLSARN